MSKIIDARMSVDGNNLIIMLDNGESKQFVLKHPDPEVVRESYKELGYLCHKNDIESVQTTDELIGATYYERASK